MPKELEGMTTAEMREEMQSTVTGSSQ